MMKIIMQFRDRGGRGGWFIWVMDAGVWIGPRSVRGPWLELTKAIKIPGPWEFN